MPVVERHQRDQPDHQAHRRQQQAQVAAESPQGEKQCSCSVGNCDGFGCARQLGKSFFECLGARSRRDPLGIQCIEDCAELTIVKFEFRQPRFPHAF